MGWITTLTADNDQIHQLPQYPDLGDVIYQAIMQIPATRKNDLPIPIGNTGMHAVESHHSRDAELIVIGGYTVGKPLGISCADDDTPEKMESYLLERLAEKHGYKLVKKRKR